MSERSDIPAAILAGGSSSRMGRDKAMLPVGGVAMLMRIARAALEACGKVCVIGRPEPADWPSDTRTTFLPDNVAAVPVENQKSTIKNSPGPLVGLITALQHADGPVLLLACDMPLLSPALLRGLLSAHTRTAAATVAFHAGWPEPTLAVYTPALLPVLRQMLAEDRRALHPLASLPGVAAWHVPAGQEAELLNVNDAASLAEAERLAAKMKLPAPPSVP